MTSLGLSAATAAEYRPGMLLMPVNEIVHALEMSGQKSRGQKSRGLNLTAF
jgi:hypothetical protein